MVQVTLVEHHWQRKGHGGITNEVDYSIWIGRMRLRGYSTHGNMQEGYWGKNAKGMAEVYARQIANEVGVPVTKARTRHAHSTVR